MQHNSPAALGAGVIESCKWSAGVVFAMVAATGAEAQDRVSEADIVVTGERFEDTPMFSVT
ncbi:hypothetical protein SPYCW_3559 [Sphingopyxis sp. EG6]|nr:hypothetical protein SPYCW_3559 [Sphingopyxis sp. EG6]